MDKYLISPSILAANFACLGSEINKVMIASDIIHFDAMDNHYVPNLTIGPIVLKSLRKYGIRYPIDVHLMAKPIEKLIVSFIESGADCIIIHPESTNNLYKSLKLIKRNGCQAGLALNPNTSIKYIKEVIDIIDVILIMSVNPGFSGQKFISSTLFKLNKIRLFINKNKLNIRLAVDGGININNICSVANAGADVFVIGSAIFRKKNYLNTINSMKKLLLKM
ncbi:MAG: ribulose-phosphate 3-epimerase [Enterobacterales bacterium]